MLATRSILAVLTVLCVGATVQTVQADATADAMKSLQGTWNIVSIASGPSEPAKSPGKGDAVKIVIAGDQMKFLDAQGDLHRLFTLHIDASKSPAWFEMGEKNGPAVPGLYKLDGDELQLCISEGDKRPTEIARGKNIELMTLKRQK